MNFSSEKIGVVYMMDDFDGNNRRPFELFYNNHRISVKKIIKTIQNKEQKVIYICQHNNDCVYAIKYDPFEDESYILLK